LRPSERHALAVVACAVTNVLKLSVVVIGSPNLRSVSPTPTFAAALRAINDLKNDVRFRNVASPDFAIRSLLSVPLKAKGEMVGLLNVFNKRSEEGFTIDDQRLLSIIASQSAQIVENVRLYEELQRRSAELRESEAKYRALTQEAKDPFSRADFAEVIRIMDRRFGESNYSVRSLFRDEQRKVLDAILTSTLQEAEALYRQIYEHRAPMMRFITSLQMPLPKAFCAAAEFVLNGYLRRALERAEIDAERITSLQETAKVEGVALDGPTLEFAFRRNLERMAKRLVVHPAETELRQLNTAVDLIQRLPFSVELWAIQNAYYRLMENVYPDMRRQRNLGSNTAADWVESFEALGRKLAVKIG